MSKSLWSIIGLGGLALMLPGTAKAEISCTASPDCISLGYTKTAADCPTGGVKCPFDGSKMFCLKTVAAYNFKMQTPTALYNVVYSDGSSSPAYTTGKTPIGIVYYLEPNTGGKKGLIMSLEQPKGLTWKDAVEYCANYVVKGTNVGDWRLPTMWELFAVTPQYMGSSSLVNPNLKTNVNNKLLTVPGGEILGEKWDYCYGYQSTCKIYTFYSAGVNNITSLLYGELYRRYGGSSYFYNNSSSSVTYNSYYGGVWLSDQYWTSSEYPGSPSGNAYMIDYTASHGIYYNRNKGYSSLFRCIMSF